MSQSPPTSCLKPIKTVKEKRNKNFKMFDNCFSILIGLIDKKLNAVKKKKIYCHSGYLIKFLRL